MDPAKLPRKPSRQKAKDHRNGFQAHLSNRHETSHSTEARAMLDRSFGGRGDIANKEQGLGKYPGKSHRRK